MAKDMDLVSRLSDDERVYRRFSLGMISPDDAKYGESSKDLKPYLSAEAEWRTFAFVQKILLETRMEFGQATQKHVDEMNHAMGLIDPLNMALLEDDKSIKHDQLAVLEEIGRFVSEETKALLHPGTTSYDLVDTARPYLLKKAWFEVIRPTIAASIESLCIVSERYMNIPSKDPLVEGETFDMLQVGRTHLQNTSPVLFGGVLAGYAARLSDRLGLCDQYFNSLKGKISGIVGTGASIDMVIGEGKSIEFEKAVLKKLGLEPDYTATQIVQKERLADVGHGLTSLSHVLTDLAEDIRKLYSSAIEEVTSRDDADRLGGSSADPTKNNPIQWENNAGTTPIIEAGMRVLYASIQSDFQRDLRNSKLGRYQPQAMMTEIYESFSRFRKSLRQLSVNEDKMAANLVPVRKNPAEAMTAILRGEGFVHSTYGVGHDFVKAIGKKAKINNKPLINIALQDPEFTAVYYTLSNEKQRILNGELELYTGSAHTRAKDNIAYAREIISRVAWRG